MREHAQSLYESLGKYGCYFLCIVELAERITGDHLDVIACINLAKDKGYISLDEDNYKDKDNFFMKNPAALLSTLTGKSYKCTKESRHYIPVKGDVIVELWETDYTTHFRLPDWEPYQNSATVRNGNLSEYRVFKEI